MEQIPKCIKIMTPVRRVASLLAAKPRIEVASDDPRRASLLRGSFQVQAKHPTTGESRSVGKYRGRIEFRDVCFSFPTERQKTILNGLNFTAEPGQKVRRLRPRSRPPAARRSPPPIAPHTLAIRASCSRGGEC